MAERRPTDRTTAFPTTPLPVADFGTMAALAEPMLRAQMAAFAQWSAFMSAQTEAWSALMRQMAGAARIDDVVTAQDG